MLKLTSAVRLANGIVTVQGCKAEVAVFHFMLVIRYCFAVGQAVLEVAWQSMVVFNFQVFVKVVS